MVYATLEAVKERLSLEHTTYDAQLNNKITQANNSIDQMLEPYETVPIAAPPQAIIDAEADWAAGLFREETMGMGAGERPMPHILRKRGMDAVQAYIEANYLGPTKRKDYLRHGKSHHAWDRDHGATEVVN